MRYSDARARESAVTCRLQRLAPLSEGELAAVVRSLSLTRRVAARRDMIAERSPDGEPRLLISGWAALSRIMIDGRRQILDLVLPGEFIAKRPKRNLPSLTTVSAITDVEVGPVIDPFDAAGGLAEAYAVSNALHEHYLHRQIARLGRLNAYERTVDWFLELHERLELSGLATAYSFTFPVTQEILADILGMTGVHVNRTLQALRKDGMLVIGDGIVTFPNIRELMNLVAFEPAGVVLGLNNILPNAQLAKSRLRR